MKIAIYSGSFNPIHNGHLAIAESVLEHGFDQVWLMVSPQNPHKTGTDLLPFALRMELARLAVKGHPGILASDAENTLPRPSYTINTLLFLQEHYPQHTFSLLVGEDNLASFHRWKDYRMILDRFGLVVYPRRDQPPVSPETASSVRWINASLLDVSSTEIREKLAAGLSVHGLMPEKSEEFLLRYLKDGEQQAEFD